MRTPSRFLTTLMIWACMAGSPHLGAAESPEAKAKEAGSQGATAAPPAAPAPTAAPATSPAPPPAANTFEARLAEGELVYNVKSLLRPFVATCDHKATHFGRLFCSALNERLKAQHQNKIFKMTVQPSEAGPLVAVFKAKPAPAVELFARGCLTCEEPLLDREGGDITKARFFMLKPPRDIRVKRGKILYEFQDIDLAHLTVPLPPKTTDKTYQTDVLPFLRLDLLFRPEAEVVKVGKGRYPYSVVLFQPMGHRLYNRCSGEVYASEPKAAGPVPVDKNDLSCPQNQPKKAVAKPKLPASLPQAQVKELMDLLAEDIKSCYEQYGVAGDVPADLVVAPNGQVKSAKVTGDLAGSDTALCVERLIKNLKFPQFVGQDARLQWPFTLK